MLMFVKSAGGVSSKEKIMFNSYPREFATHWGREMVWSRCCTWNIAVNAFYNIIANVDLESSINSYGIKNIRKASNDIYSEFTDINKIY